MTKWTSTPIDLSSHIRKNKAQNKLVYPLFEECAKLTDDQLWIDLFLACAKDKFPKGFIFQNGYLKHRKGTKFKQFLVPDSAMEAMPAVKKFISENGSIFSHLDKRIQDEFIDSVSYRKEYNSFSEIKKNRSVFNEYIGKYIRGKNFDFKSMHYLLNFGFDYGILSEKDITLENGEIVNIDGVEVGEQEEYFLSESKVDKLFSKKKTSSKVAKKTLEDEIWGNCLKKLLAS